MTAVPDDPQDSGYAVLGPGEAAILTAAVSVMWPADDAGPDAAALGVVRYIDRALAGAEHAARASYGEGLRWLDIAAVSDHDHRFAELPSNAQAALLAYTFENVRLMYLSGDTAHPAGLGNNSDQLGRHFMTKQFPSVYGSYPGRRFNRHTGPGAQGPLIEDFLVPDFPATSGLSGGGTLSLENQLLPIQIAREPLPPRASGGAGHLQDPRA